MAHSVFNFPNTPSVSSWAEDVDKMDSGEFVPPRAAFDNPNFVRSPSSMSTLLQLAAENGGCNFNIFINSSDTKALPKKDPRIIHKEIKDKVTSFPRINNLKFTRNGSILISTQDLECACEITQMTEVLGLPVVTKPIFENITNRFLLFDIPVATPLNEIAFEIESANNIKIFELRRFVRRNSTSERAPILVTSLGTALPPEIILWFTRHRIRQFIDKPRQCGKCFKFNHVESKCRSASICVNCGGISHEGICANPVSCVNCKEEHRADFNQCSHRKKEAEFLSYKCINFLSFIDARRQFSKLESPVTYAKKTAEHSNDFDSFRNFIEQRTNNLLQIMNSVITKLSEQIAVLSDKIISLADMITQNSTDFKHEANRIIETVTAVANSSWPNSDDFNYDSPKKKKSSGPLLRGRLRVLACFGFLYFPGLAGCSAWSVFFLLFFLFVLIGSQREQLSILQWNCRGIRSKLDWLKTPAFYLTDILVLQETFLSPDFSFSLPGKVIYRSDRIGRPGGGLLIAVCSSLSSSRLTFDSAVDGNELMGVSFFFGSREINLINVYSPSGAITRDLNKVCQSIRGSTFLLGDFNLHHPCWGAPVSSALSDSFCNWVVEEKFCIINTTDSTHIAPNRSRSLLDLSLCSPDLLANVSYRVLDDLYDSDHFPVCIDFTARAFVQDALFSYRWDRISQQINSELQERADIDYDHFMCMIQDAMDQNACSVQRAKRKQPPWWTRRCSALLQQKKFLFRKATSTLSVSFWIQYKRAASTLRRTLKEAKRSFWDSICSQARDPRVLFKVFKRIRNVDSANPDSHFTLLHEGLFITDAQAQVNLFDGFFNNQMQIDPITLDYGDNDNMDLNNPFSLDELKLAIRLTKSTSPGLDKISAAFFKGLNEKSLTLLLQIYNMSWSSGHLPEEWRTSLIIPVSKPGKKKCHIESYRPIALTAVMVKICERMIVRRLTDHIIRYKLIDSRLLGFLPFRDSQTAIDMLHMNIANARKLKKHIVAVALDIQQAYDSVHVDNLMLKCAQLNIRGNILRWIHQFLHYRFLFVKWRNITSSGFFSLRGVPQGSVLSPLLFAIYMSDFFETLEGGVDGLIYADDIFLYVFKDCLEDCRISLQFSLQNVARWINYGKLRIRPDKCSAIVLSRRRGDACANLSIDGGRIPWVSVLKFLGFMISRRGGFRHHVTYLRRKAFRRIALLKALATCRYGARSFHLVTLVASSIRSLTDYAAPTLSRCCDSLFGNLEVIQSSALRVALGLPRWTPNILLRKAANFVPLAERIHSLSARFWIKHRSLGPWSPFYGPFGFPSLPLDDIFEEFDCRPDQLLTFCFPIPCDRVQPLIHIDDLEFQNKGLHDFMIHVLFQNFFDALCGRYDCIATDASKSDAITAIAGVSDSAQFGYRIPHINSIFTAEALALCSVFNELIWDRTAVIILSDSRSALWSLRNCNRHSPKVILHLHNKLVQALNRGTRIMLVWVPGHRGIRYNELADKLAKSVSASDASLDWISPEDLISSIAWSSNSRIEQQFRGSKYFSSHGHFPNIHSIHSWVTNRRLDVLVIRLVCQMLITPTLLFRFGLADSEICSQCNDRDSITHILFSCKKYDGFRKRFWLRSGGDIAQFASFPDFVTAFCESAEFRWCTIQFLLSMDRF